MSVFPFNPDLSEDEQVSAIAEKLASQMPGFRLDAVHCYRDESGVAIYWRFRLKNHATGEKRPFPLRRCADGFELKEPDFPKGKKPLYGLERLANNPDAQVWIVEGEWCVDWMARLGLVAVTSGGAGSAKRADWSPLDCTAPQLRGLTAIIFRDNDESGRRYAAEVTPILRRLGRAVEWVDMAALNLPEGGDYVDWRKANPTATAADVEALPRIAPPAAAASAGADTVGNSPADPTPLTVCFAEIQPVPIRWLWPGRIARGKVTMIAGNPGLGKSQVIASLAAIVSSGGRWPVSGEKCEPGGVLILSAEDDAADTIRPRLDAAGANARGCHHFRAQGFTLEAVGMLEEAARQIGEPPALITIDPITAYMGGADSHKNADVRAVLAHLADFAAGIGAAVVCVSHLNKSGGTDALARVTGSLAFTAAARAAYLVAKDEDDPGRRLFLPMKNNLGKDEEGCSFRIETAHLPDEIETSRIVWGGDPVTQTANEIMEAAAQTRSGDRSELEEAEEFLREYPPGDYPVQRLKSETGAAGLSWWTVKRAGRSLGVVHGKEKGSLTGKHYWTLPPPKCANKPEVCHEKNMAQIGELGTDRDGEDPDASSTPSADAGNIPGHATPALTPAPTAPVGREFDL